MQTATANTDLSPSSRSATTAWIDSVLEGLDNGRLAPYLGPGIFAGVDHVPGSYAQLAAFFGDKVALPRRARGDLWASAQYVESRKHRNTLDAIMTEAFAEALTPLPIHRALAQRGLPLIVDTWYDGCMRSALGDRSSWVEVQGGTRAAIGEERFYRTYAPSGAELAHGAATDATTVLYKPHGSIAPARNYLVSDADYVEVLTEIDIQTPIPKAVQERRSTLGFVYLGCRFHDQTLRIVARQVAKRSPGPRFALVDPQVGLTPNEARFLQECQARLVVAPPEEVLARLAGG